MKKLRKWLVPETLSQRVLLMIETFVVNHALFFIILALAMVAAADFYNRYLRVDLDTDHIDLMKKYNQLQLRRRYKL